MEKNNNNPLLPVADLMSQEIPGPSSSISESVDKAVAESLKKAKGSETERIRTIMNDEISRMSTVQEQNNEEIRKKASDLQVLKDKNLVLAGAISSLKKVMESIASK